MPRRRPRNFSTCAGLRPASSLTLSSERSLELTAAAMVTCETGAANSGADVSASESATAFKQCIANPLSRSNRLSIDRRQVAPALWISALIEWAFWIKLRHISRSLGGGNGNCRSVRDRPQSVGSQILFAHGDLPRVCRAARLRPELLFAGHCPILSAAQPDAAVMGDPARIGLHHLDGAHRCADPADRRPQARGAHAARQ